MKLKKKIEKKGGGEQTSGKEWKFQELCNRVEVKEGKNKKIVFLFCIERFRPQFGFIPFGGKDNSRTRWAYGQTLSRCQYIAEWLAHFYSCLTTVIPIIHPSSTEYFCLLERPNLFAICNNTFSKYLVEEYSVALLC
jgi:hypothetical protein